MDLLFWRGLCREWVVSYDGSAQEGRGEGGNCPPNREGSGLQAEEERETERPVTSLPVGEWNQNLFWGD